MKSTLELRDYQEEISNNAVVLLKKYKIAYLAMQVRTGKTLTAMATAYKFGAKSVLFVTKKKAISDIVNQFSASKFELGIYVINFEQLGNVKESFDLIIIDEAHSLSAFPVPSGRAKELKRICFGKPIIYLSGTPNPESFSQLYHQFWVSSYSPFDYHKTFYKWANDFVYVKKMMINGQSFNDYKKADEKKVMECCKHLFITYTQEQAGFESFVQETVHHVEMQESTYKFAERLRIDKIMTNKDGEVVLADTAVKLMQKLHQLWSGTVKFENGNSMTIDTTKAEFIKSQFATSKIGVFYKFKEELSALKDVFGKDLTEKLEDFDTGQYKVIALQIVSGREGISLKNADYVVFYNIDFSATSYWQARDRMTTMERKFNKVYWIFSAGGIEDKIYKAVKSKKSYTLNIFKKDYEQTREDK